MDTPASEPRSLTQLSSPELTARLAELLGDERRCLVDFLFHLGELDRRRTYLDLAHPSLFAYCTDALKLPNGSAWRRTTAARLLVRFPSAADYLRDGRLSLTTLLLLKDVLEPHNHRELLASAAGRTEDEVKVQVATLQPRPEVKDSIRRLPTRAPPAPAPSLVTSAQTSADVAAIPAGVTSSLEVTQRSSGAAHPSPSPVPAPRRPRIEPIDAERRALHMTVGKEFMEELAQVKSALSHIVPDGNLEALFRVCFQKTLEVCARRKRGGAKPRTSAEPRRVATVELSAPGGGGTAANATSTSSLEVTPAKSEAGPEVAAPARTCPSPQAKRYIPAEVRRKVWERDEGRCTFVGPDGRRCSSTHQLEFDHVKAFALGGEATVENVCLRCRAHNLHRARQQFGEAHMAKFARGAQLTFI